MTDECNTIVRRIRKTTGRPSVRLEFTNGLFWGRPSATCRPWPENSFHGRPAGLNQMPDVYPEPRPFVFNGLRFSLS